MDTPQPTRSKLSTFKPLGLVLVGVVAGTLFAEMLRPAAAFAQDGKQLPPEKILNSGELSKQIIAAINQVNDRLGRVESTLNAGLKVKVTEMPPVIVKEASK